MWRKSRAPIARGKSSSTRYVSAPSRTHRVELAPPSASRRLWRCVYIQILQGHLRYGEKKELAAYLGISPQMLSALLHPDDRRVPSPRVIDRMLRFFEDRMEPHTFERFHLALLRAAGQPALKNADRIRRADPVELMHAMERFLESDFHLRTVEGMVEVEEWLERTARLIREPCPPRERWVYVALRMAALAAAAGAANVWDDLPHGLRWGKEAEAWARRLGEIPLPGTARPWRSHLLRWMIRAAAASASSWYNMGNPRRALRRVEDALRWLEDLQSCPGWRSVHPPALLHFYRISLASARIPYGRWLPDHPWPFLERTLDHLRSLIETKLGSEAPNPLEPLLWKWEAALRRYMAQAILDQEGPPSRAWSWLSPAWDQMLSLDPLGQVMILRTAAEYAWRVGDLDLFAWTLQEAIRRAHKWGFRNQLVKIRRDWSRRAPALLEETFANFNQL